MKRKILSLILVAAMLASLLVFVPTAGATESKATVETTNAVASAGDTVKIDVKITTSALQLNTFRFAYEYDSSRLTYKSITFPQLAGGYGTPSEYDNNESFTQWTHNGPYRTFGFTTYNAITVDASEGLVVATLEFEVKGDAVPGDALVAIRNLHGEDSLGYYYTANIGNSTEDIFGNEMTFITSNVTVLPEGYLTANDASEFDIEDGVLVDYLGEADVVVIPSNVTTIATGAINGIEASKIIIPSTVQTVEKAAIANCENLSAVYVLGDETAVAEYSIGWFGTVRASNATGFRGDAFVSVDGVAAVTTIYGKAGSTAETYASTATDLDELTLGWAESALCTLTYNNSSYIVAADAKAPGTMVIDGKKVVGWNDGTKTYAAGTTMALTGDTTLTPVTVTAPVTSTEVDFKLAQYEKGNASSDLAFRFTANFSKADLAILDGMGDVSIGMLITPALYVSKAGSFTKEALSALSTQNGAYINIAIDGFYKETTTDYIFAGSVKNFSAATLAKNPNFAAVLYITVTTDADETFTLYGDFNFEANQNVKSVANKIATTDPELTASQKGWLEALISSFAAQ